MRGIKFILYLLLFSAMIGPVAAQNYYIRKKLSISSRKYDEMSPVMLGNKMVYISNRPVTGPKFGISANNHDFFKIVEAEITTDLKSKSQDMFDETLNSKFHDGPVTFNEKGDFMAFSRCFDVSTSKKNVSKFGLYFATLHNGKWEDIQEFEYNDRNANSVYPSFNKDATLMYFASDREGGFGKFDLYVSKFVNGRWSAPENLGPRINTSNDERFPFLHSSGRLYFSSDGHDNNAGGYDLFYSEMYNGKWIAPVKLPADFNSNQNEYSIYIDDKFEKGFFTNSKGGSKDIWSFTSIIPTFEVSQKQKENNYCFVFFEENTVDLDTMSYQYEWNLGDGAKVRSLEAQHCFAGPGKYNVSLNVIDKLTKEVLFSQAEYEMNIEKIVQAYITCPDKIKVNEDTQFSGQDSYFKDISVGEYYWDFGDGNKGIGASIRHTYVVPGTYTIKLGVVKTTKGKEAPGKFCSYKTIVVTEN